MGRFSRWCERRKREGAAFQVPRGDAPSQFYLNTRNQGDGRDLLRSRGDGSVALVFFDPQYRAGLDKLDYGNEGARQIERAKLPQMPDAMIAEFGAEVGRILRPMGHLMLWVDKFTLVESTWRQWLGADLLPVDMITWEKPQIGMGYRSRRKSEYLMVFQKPPMRAKDVWRIDAIPDVWGVNEWLWQREHLPTWRSGPHRKPVSLQSRLIACVTSPGDLVLDPCAGSYSTLDSARHAGRDFLGCDLR